MYPSRLPWPQELKSNALYTFPWVGLGTGELIQPLQAPRAGREGGPCHAGLCANTLVLGWAAHKHLLELLLVHTP